MRLPPLRPPRSAESLPAASASPSAGASAAAPSHVARPCATPGRSSRLRLGAALVAACFLAAGCARDDASWPRHTIRLAVGYPAGRGADGLAPALAQAFGTTLGATVHVVETHGASSGAVAARYVATSPPDGYTLLVGSADALTLAPLLDTAGPEDSGPPLCPLALLERTPYVLMVRANANYDTVDDLVAAARRHPGDMSYASPGTNSGSHALGQLFARDAGIQLTAVPYRNSGAAVASLLASNVTMVFDTVQAAMPALRGGDVRAVAITGDRRLPSLPDVPSFAERGYPELSLEAWYGLLAPCGLPREVETRLLAATSAALSRSEVQSVLGPDATSPPLAGDAFDRYLDEDRQRWRLALARAATEHAVPMP